MLKRLNSEKVVKTVLLIAASVSVLAVIAIFLFILINSIPVFREVGFFKFIIGDEWNASKGEFGILPMIVGSLCVTAGSIIIGVTIGIFSSVYISSFLNKRFKKIVINIINLLAGIPSVIFGFFGMKVVVPMITSVTGLEGDGILAASIILSIMILPTIISLSVNAIESVDKSYYEGSLSLGVNKERSVFKVMLPSAKSGIFTAVVLAIGRAMGETMAVVMVAGNSPVFPTGLISSIRTMTTNIIMEMGYAERGSIHMSALIGTGFVLFLFILIINISLNLIRDMKKDGKESKIKEFISDKINKLRKTTLNVNGINTVSDAEITLKEEKKRERIVKAENVLYKGLKYLSLVSSLVSVIMLIIIIGFISVNGIPYLSIEFLFGGKDAEITIFPSIVNTLIMIVFSLLIALPIGISSAIYLNEYTKKNNKIVKVIRLATETLAGVPSIIFGLFGMLMFKDMMGLGYSLLAGILTLSIMILPTIVRSTEESLIAIPDSVREGSLALGATKKRTVFKVVLPSAISGIISAIILSIGRIVGESAALIFTAGSNPDMVNSILDAGASLTVRMYVLANEGLYPGYAFATAFVLICIVVLLNLCSVLVESKVKKKYGGK